MGCFCSRERCSEEMDVLIGIYTTYIAGYGEMYIRICISAIIGFLIGLDRDPLKVSRRALKRTHLFVWLVL